MFICFGVSKKREKIEKNFHFFNVHLFQHITSTEAQRAHPQVSAVVGERDFLVNVFLENFWRILDGRFET